MGHLYHGYVITRLANPSPRHVSRSKFSSCNEATTSPLLGHAPRRSAPVWSWGMEKMWQKSARNLEKSWKILENPGKILENPGKILENPQDLWIFRFFQICQILGCFKVDDCRFWKKNRMEHGFEIWIEEEWNRVKSTLGPTRDANGIPMVLFRELKLLQKYHVRLIDTYSFPNDLIWDFMDFIWFHGDIYIY